MKPTEQIIVITSGPIAAGKSSIVTYLVGEHEYRKLSSGNFLRNRAKQISVPPTRLELVRIGDQLDVTTDFAWVVSEVAVPALRADPTQNRWIFDSVRKRRQVEHFRSHFRGAVFHVHFYAPEQVLRARFEKRGSQTDLKTTYEVAIDTPNEREARSLIDFADLVIDTSQVDKKDSARRVTEGLSQWSLLS